MQRLEGQPLLDDVRGKILEKALGRLKPTARIASTSMETSFEGSGTRSGNKSQNRPKMVSAALADNCWDAMEYVSATNGGCSAPWPSRQAPTCLITVPRTGSRRIKWRRALV
jgi:hypothetical protein